jgi:hypothetical protein
MELATDRRSSFSFALVALASLALPGLAQERARPAPPAPGWDPAHTWVFAAGCLSWTKSDQFTSYPTEGRRDVELVGALRAAGVADDRIVFLKDGECTLARLERELHALLGKTHEGDLVVFYYTGHGSQEDDGSADFAPYDGDVEAPATLWPVAKIVDAIAREGKHDRALLLGDCCYSGALVDEAQRRADGRVSFAALTSTLRTSESTGRWTFTECLLDGLQGRARIDADGDAEVELDELARYSEETLAFEDDQLTAFATTGRFDPHARLARVAAPLPGEHKDPHEGERVLALSEDTWCAATVLASDGERRRVHYAGYESSEDEWVGPDHLRPWTPPAVRPKGQRVEIEWEGKWYPGTILDQRLGLHRVHYDDFEAVWDEWVAADRLRDPKAAPPVRRRH